jgi:hypothetical protein
LETGMKRQPRLSKQEWLGLHQLVCSGRMRVGKMYTSDNALEPHVARALVKHRLAINVPINALTYTDLGRNRMQNRWNNE